MQFALAASLLYFSSSPFVHLSGKSLSTSLFGIQLSQLPLTNSPPEQHCIPEPMPPGPRYRWRRSYRCDSLAEGPSRGC